MSEPNWVDYANLGANITNVAVNTAQLQTLYEVNTQLAQLSQIEANRERRRQLENNLRQFVFDEETKLHQLKGRSDVSPLVFWVSAHIIRQNLESVPITAASFQEFVDKDRVRTFTTELLAAINESESRLNSDQLNRARLALKYLSERSSLDELIETQKASEFLSKTNAQHTELDGIAQGSRKKAEWGCVLIIVGTLVMTLLLGVFLLIDSAFIFVPVIGVILVWLWLRYSVRIMVNDEKQYDELKAQRSEAAKTIPSPARQNELVAQFGQGLTSQQLRDLKNDRETKLPMLLSWP